MFLFSILILDQYSLQSSGISRCVLLFCSVEVDALDLAPEDSTVSIPWSVLAHHFTSACSLEATEPDIVGWVGWVHHSRTTGQEVFDISLQIAVFPA